MVVSSLTILFIAICVLHFVDIQFLVDASPRFIYDRRTNETVDHTWCEIGFSYLDDVNWVNITTKNNESTTDVVVFISLPDIGGSLYNESIPLVPKMLEAPQRMEDGTWSFFAKLIQAKGSFCSTEWYIPAPIEPVQITWMAVEKNLFEVSVYDENSEFQQYQSLLISSSNITRNNSDSDLSDGATNGNGNFERIW
jgi:hypothetical protein